VRFHRREVFGVHLKLCDASIHRTMKREQPGPSDLDRRTRRIANHFECGSDLDERDVLRVLHRSRENRGW
jgi:hypothetical protein